MPHRFRTVRGRRSSPVYKRSDSLLIGPGGQIVAATPAKDDPHVTGLLPEDIPIDNEAGGDGDALPAAPGDPDTIPVVRTSQHIISLYRLMALLDNADQHHLKQCVVDPNRIKFFYAGCTINNNINQHHNI